MVPSLYKTKRELPELLVLYFAFQHSLIYCFCHIIMPEVYAAPPDFAFPRNFKGYGEKGLEGLKWPKDAKIAVSFVINYEEVSQC